MVTTKMNWSGPNCDFLPKWITFGPDQFVLVMTISFWSWPNHYGQVQINLVGPKPFWTDQNCFGHIEGQGIRVFHVKSKYWWSKIDALWCAHRRILQFLANSHKRALYSIQIQKWFSCRGWTGKTKSFFPKSCLNELKFWEASEN